MNKKNNMLENIVNKLPEITQAFKEMAEAMSKLKFDCPFLQDKNLMNHRPDPDTEPPTSRPKVSE